MLSKTKSSQRGFASIELVLVLVVVAAIAGVGVYVMRSNQKSKDSAANAETASNQLVKKSGVTADIKPIKEAGTASALQTVGDNDAADESATEEKEAENESNDAKTEHEAVKKAGDSYNESDF